MNKKNDFIEESKSFDPSLSMSKPIGSGEDDIEKDLRSHELSIRNMNPTSTKDHNSYEVDCNIKKTK